jgi:hypothetical protein
MANRTISVDPETAKKNSAAIARQIELLPSASVVSRHQGTSVGVTSDFHAAMSTVALNLPLFVDQLRTTLQQSKEGIEQTVAELTGQDQAIADAADALAAGIAAIGSPTSTADSTPKATQTDAGNAEGWD